MAYSTGHSSRLRPRIYLLVTAAEDFLEQSRFGHRLEVRYPNSFVGLAYGSGQCEYVTDLPEVDEPIVVPGCHSIALACACA